VLAPFPMAPRAGRLRPGEVIPIHGVDHAYFAFRTRDGELAFVNSADVDLVPRDPTRPLIVPDAAGALRRLTIRDLELTGPGLPEELAPSDEAEAERIEPEVGEREEGGEVLEPAVLLSKVSPVYPESARSEGIQGSVILEVAIDASGRVTEVAVVRGLPYGLSESAVEAVKHWHYRPARGPGGPVPSRKMVRILYSLER
jgi:TonB family protein